MSELSGRYSDKLKDENYKPIKLFDDKGGNEIEMYTDQYIEILDIIEETYNTISINYKRLRLLGL
jgi:hypothetical protein